MKIVILNTTDDVGGAAIAAQRIATLYRQEGHEVNFICLKQKGENTNSKPLITNFFQKLAYAYKVKMEANLVKKYTLNQGFNFSTGWLGNSLKSIDELQKADIIHLHWVNHTFISLQGLAEILKMNKKIIWTLHDMWAFTGGCHHSKGCLEFQNSCSPCHLLKNRYKDSISKMILDFKLKSFSTKNLTIVSPSQWLLSLAKSSKLLTNAKFELIANPLDTELFRPEEVYIKNEKFTILFGAANALVNKQKGIDYLIEAIRIFKTINPELDFILKIFGTGKDLISNDWKDLPIELLGNIHSQSDLVSQYQSADLFCLPSLEENLPNTIMEALSCGTPSVPFDVGGICDMIENGKTGYLCEYKSPESLAMGMDKIYKEEKLSFSIHCRNKALQLASYEIVKKAYTKLLV